MFRERGYWRERPFLFDVLGRGLLNGLKILVAEIELVFGRKLHRPVSGSGP